MQPSDQQPAAETQKQDTSEEQLAFQPLYEFPPDGPLANVTPQPSPVTKVLPVEELENKAIDEEAIQRNAEPCMQGRHRDPRSIISNRLAIRVELWWISSENLLRIASLVWGAV